MATHNCGISSRSRVHPSATPHAFPLTNTRHSLLSCTILASLTSKLLFFKQSHSINPSLPRLNTERLQAHSSTYLSSQSYHSPSSPYGRSTGEHLHQSRPRWTQKTFADVGNFLTTSVFAGLSKYSGFILLKHKIHRQKEQNNIPYKTP